MTRGLTHAEIIILERLLNLSSTTLDATWVGLQVEEMSDGGMGGIRFIHGQGEPARFGKALVAAKAVDQDGTELSLALNLDQFGRLFELDIWKVDFSRLQALPDPEALVPVEA